MIAEARGRRRLIARSLADWHKTSLLGRSKAQSTIGGVMRQQDYLDISCSPDMPTFESRLVRFANRLDFGLVSGALMLKRPGQPLRKIDFGNFPTSFPNYQSAEVGKRSPVNKRLRATTVPFVYDQAMYVLDGAADLWEEQAPFGYRNGIAVGFNSGCEHFIFGVDRDAPLAKKTLERLEQWLICIC